MRRHALVVVLVSIVLVLIWLGARVWIEWKWFEQFSFVSVLLRRWLLQLAGLLLGLGLAVGLQIWLGWIWQRPRGGHKRIPLAPRAYGLALLVLLAMQLIPVMALAGLARRLVLEPFDPRRLHGWIGLEGMSLSIALLISATVVVALVWKPLSVARIWAALAALAGGVVMGRAWGVWGLAALAPNTGIEEPLLHGDISFSLVRYPALALALSLLISLLVANLSAALWGLIARHPQLSDGRFTGSALSSRVAGWPVGRFVLVG